MTKQQFLTVLRHRLSYLPQEELDERLHFYAEMIDDRMEEGFSEEEAVAAAGSVDEIAKEMPTEPKAKRQRRWWEITLLVLGFPVWLPLLIAAVAVIFSLLVAAVAVIFSLFVTVWACFIAIVASAFACIVAGIVFSFSKLSGVAVVAAGLVCAGLSIFLFYACIAITKWLCRMPKIIKGRKYRA